MKKKIIKILVMFICLILVLLAVFLVYFYFWFSSSRLEVVPNEKSYKYERYETPKDQTIYFVKEYYYENADEFYKKNGNYKLVENDVETIKNYISTSLDKLYELDNTINIEFNYDNITPNDYYDLSGGYNLSKGDDVLLYYYDVDEHILYVTHFFK